MAQTIVRFYEVAAAAADEAARLLALGWRVAVGGPADTTSILDTGDDARDGPVNERPFVLVATRAPLEKREPDD